jgi:hypothetical protein
LAGPSGIRFLSPTASIRQEDKPRLALILGKHLAYHGCHFKGDHLPWLTSNAASDGRTYSFCRQVLTNQCGPASVATLFNLKFGKQIDLGTVGSWHVDGEGVSNVSKDNIRDFEGSGSWYNGTIAALSKLKLHMHATKGFANAGKWVVEARSKPAILSVGWYVQVNGQWQRAGGHWVVAVKVHGNHVICLDPGLDTGIVEIDTGTPNQYDVDYGGGAQTGWIDGIILP